MKKILIGIGIFLAILVIGFAALKTYTKSHSPSAVAKYSKNGLEISVEYCQPSKKGRNIFGGLLPYGELWRTGANEATLITFNKDVEIGVKKLKAGQYSIYTIPNEASWTIIFNKETGQWGTGHDETQDVVKLNVSVQKLASEVEMFTISLDEENQAVVMNLQWDKTKVGLPLARISR